MTRLQLAICLSTCLFLSFVFGCGKKAEEPPPPPRAVTVMTLQETNPGAALGLTGSVESFKEEDIGFEVSGRVSEVVEPGEYVEGPIEGREGVSQPGKRIAALDDERYKVAVELAKAQVDVARIEFEGLLPAQLQEAQANLDLATEDLKKAQRLFDQGAATEDALLNAIAKEKAAQAKVKQIEASKKAKKAQWHAAEEVHRQAEIDLEKCKLLAPFSGQVSKVHVIPGGTVQPGQPVVTLVMMNPLSVELAVSPETDRDIHFQDIVSVFFPDMNEWVSGAVWHKSTEADPKTRTFKVSVVINNRMVESDLPADESLHGLPRATKLWPLTSGDISMPEIEVIEESALFEDEQGTYVLKVVGLSWGERGDAPDLGPVFTVHKVHIKTGEKRFVLPGVWRLVEVIDRGGLNVGDVTAIGELGDVKHGKQVLFSQPNWLFRPGDVAEVQFGGQGFGPGFYVPMSAILKEGDTHSVFIVKDKSRAHKVQVTLGGWHGELRRVKEMLVDEEQEPLLVAGETSVVIKGAHYLDDGEAVNPFEAKGAGQ